MSHQVYHEYCVRLWHESERPGPNGQHGSYRDHTEVWLRGPDTSHSSTVLWIQEAVQRKRIVMRKIKGSMNPADHSTKPQNKSEYEELLKTVGGEIRSDVLPD